MSFRGESEIFPWLKTIFRRSLVDLLRRRQPEQPLPRSDELDAEVEETFSSITAVAAGQNFTILHVNRRNPVRAPAYVP